MKPIKVLVVDDSAVMRQVAASLIGADPALQLLAAPNCPTGRSDLLLMPDQMMLQIHESIGHPLELATGGGGETQYIVEQLGVIDQRECSRLPSTDVVGGVG